MSCLDMWVVLILCCITGASIVREDLTRDVLAQENPVYKYPSQEDISPTSLYLLTGGKLEKNNVSQKKSVGSVGYIKWKQTEGNLSFTFI